MNEHTLKVLEFDKVKSIVAAYAASAAGRDLVTGLHPAVEEGRVESLLRETGELVSVLEGGEYPPLAGISDLRPIIGKLLVTGSMLSPLELLQSAQTLAAGRRLKKFFLRLEGKTGPSAQAAPLLCEKAATITALPDIEEAVFSAIDERAEVKDAASPDLRRIRKQLARIREDILGRMTGILQDTGFQKVIQEPVVTIRDDRFVLPLKPNFRQSLKGVVHGQSGSRATLFVEPLDVLEQNNRLAELRMDERDEVERILRRLTALFGSKSEAVQTMVAVLAEIDAVTAKARFGIEYDAVVPLMARDRTIRLKNARHPLLVNKTRSGAALSVTPNTVEIEPGRRAMILSGPNAGGKTAILKTVGLLCLMAQSGIPIPCSEGSELPCFGSLFADIGDEQSLEQDLSTFSSHVSQIAGILREADRDSLVLLDELGSGTEPGEGAGLGAAVLESLIERGCVTVVTTHHNALKLFGSETAGAVNAAMEFDPQTLKPTYRLIPGRPGRSYGLDMASRLGIPESVIHRARTRINRDDARLEKLLEQMEADARVLAAEREALARELTAARQQRAEAEAALHAVRDEVRDTKAKAKAEAGETLSALRQKLRELSRTAALEQAAAKRERAEVEALARSLEPEKSEDKPAEPGRELHAGDRVRVSRLNKTGTVLGAQKNSVEIEVGGKKIKLAPSEVVPLEGAGNQQAARKTPGWGTEIREEQEGPVGRLNIIGLRVVEALEELDRFIDRAQVNHLSVVTIIHGLGTGALKSAVADFLRNHPLVASIRQGESAEGGAGVTVAELKK